MLHRIIRPPSRHRLRLSSRRYSLLPALLVILASAASFAQTAPPLLTEDFESPRAAARWQIAGAGTAQIIETPDQNHVLQVRTDHQSDEQFAHPLPIDQIRGHRLAISARVKADNVVKAIEPWHGLKVMLQTESPHGPDYQQVPSLAGTFDWKEVGFTALVPPDATSAKLILGLGQATGAAWFDGISLVVQGNLRHRPATQPVLLPPEQLDRRTGLPRLRGVMYGPHGNANDLRALAGWRANLIRWQFFDYGATLPEKRLDLAAYDRWLAATMAEVDALLPLCRTLGLHVVIDLHTPPGGTDAGQMAIFESAACQQKFLAVWDQLAAHYKDEPSIWAYDLLNEPVEGRVADGLMDWRTLSEHAARRIRAIDPRHAVIVEPGPSGGWANLPYLDPLPLPGIIYSVHMYEPLRFTHQGVLDGFSAALAYPGWVDGVYWDKEQLRKTLAPVREYQKDYNIPIYIGEFSAIRWAPDGSAARYLRDCISLFEEYGWDWSYHAFREWQGWNVEIGSDKADPSPAATPTDREQVLTDAFRKNFR